MESFSDFAEKRPVLDGEKVKIDDVLNKKIIITGFKIDLSKYEKGGKYVRIQFKEKEDESPFVCFTCSGVLMEQLETYESHIPFSTAIKKVNKYYTMS